MSRQSADQSAGYMRTLSFMSLVQSEVRESPEFSKLLGESAVEHLRGAAWQRHSICQAKWTLQGANGTVELHASHANDFGCNLVTKLSLKSPDIGPKPVSIEYGGDRPESSVETIVTVLLKWLPIITRGSSNPYEGVSVPRA